MREWWSKLQGLVRRDHIAQDLRAEMDAHLQMEVDANLDRGMTPGDARDVARRRFGNRTSIEESSREAWVFLALETLAQDLRYGLRLLARSPGFTITSISVIALGIGANTAAFTLVNHVLLRPLPFPQPEQLVCLKQAERPTLGSPRMELTPPNFEDWRARSTSFSAMGAYVPVVGPVNLSGEGEPERLNGLMIGAGVFETLRVQPAAGRAFTPDDEREGADKVALFSHELATTLFGDAASAVGRTVRLSYLPTIVVGVMPRGFAFPYRDIDVWTPLRIGVPAWSRRNHLFDVIARLRPGVTISEARADLNVIAAQLEEAYPKENEGVRAEVLELRDVMSPQSRTLVLAIFAAALCLLLIACTNLANLMFARAMGRRQELAVRMALGAPRARIVRQLLTENVFLALAGGALGLLLALLVTPALTMLVPSRLPVGATPEIDWRVFVFALIVTVATSVSFGVGPAFRSSRSADQEALRSRAATGGRTDRVRAALVLAEIVGTVVLLVAAGLLLKAMWRVQSVDPGFRTDGVLTMRTALPSSLTAAERRDFYTRVLADVRSLPSVTSAAYMGFLPMTWPAGNLTVTAPGMNPADETRANTRFITKDYFRTLGIPLLRGRDVREADDETAARVTVVSESLARRLWPEQDPLGRTMTLARIEWTVVGLVGDVAVQGLERDSPPQAYFPYDQMPGIGAFYAPKDLVVHSSGDPMALAPAVRRIIRGVDPQLAIADVRPLESLVASQTATRRDQLFLLGAFAGIAFLLAAVGIHGLLSFIVSARTQEVGIRVALGAERGAIVRLFLRQGLVLGALGVAIAVPLAYASARGMRALLFGVEPADPSIYVAAAVLAMVMALVSSLHPAFRAATIDPAATIRQTS